MVCNSTFVRFALTAFALATAYPAHGEAAKDDVAQVALADTHGVVEKAATGEPGMRIKPQPQGESLGLLGRLYEQRLLIKAQVELMNAQAQLKTKGVTTAKIAESYAPTVKMVQGVGDNVFATFLYPGNMTMDARVGDTISGGYKVEAISVNQVVLSKDGERMRLGFSASPPTPLPALDGQNGPSMPPMAGSMGGNLHGFQ